MKLKEINILLVYQLISYCFMNELVYICEDNVQ